MKGKLSRKWARISIVCMGIFIGGCFVTFFTNHYMGWLIGLPFMIAAFAIKFTVLRCPDCGKSSAVPQWAKSGTYYCPRCSTKLEYDDIEN